MNKMTFSTAVRRRRIEYGMTQHGIVAAMAEGKPSVILFLSKFIARDPDALTYIGYMDELGIYGWEIHNLWEHAAMRNWDFLKTTLQKLKSGQYSDDIIHENLNSSSPKPFY